MAETARFEIGSVISRTLAGIGENIQLVVVLGGLLAFLPSMALGLLKLSQPQPIVGQNSLAEISLTLVGSLLVGLFALALKVALIHALIGGWNGRKPAIREAFAVNGDHYLKVLLTGILAGLGILLGLVALVIPGIFLSLAWSVAQTVAVTERWKGPQHALGRSFELTRNHRWAIFGVTLILGLVIGLAGGVLGACGVALDMAISGRASGILSNLIVNPLTTTASTVISAAAMASIYFELLRIKEGGGVQVAAVFD